LKVEAQDYLKLVQKCNSVLFFDIESTGLNGDYDSTLVTSFQKYYDKAPYSYFVINVGNDVQALLQAKAELEAADLWVSYYGKGFDIPFLNTRLLKHGFAPIQKKPHLDFYYTLSANLKTSRRSLAHIARWLELEEQKMDVPPTAWSNIVNEYDKYMPLMINRCESDVRLLLEVYAKCAHLVKEIKA